MFGKNKIVEKPVEKTKEEWLGPKPADIPNTEELITFQILLRHSLPSINVEAHAHDFGRSGDGFGGNSYFTHFIVRGDITWIEDQRWHEVRQDSGRPYLLGGYYSWRWLQHEPVNLVFSIRADDVVMVVALDNAKPVETEVLALESRVPEPVAPRKPGGMVSAPVAQFIDDRDFEVTP